MKNWIFNIAKVKWSLFIIMILFFTATGCENDSSESPEPTKTAATMMAGSGPFNEPSSKRTFTAIVLSG